MKAFFTLLYLVLLTASLLQAQQDVSLPGLVVLQDSRTRTGKQAFVDNVLVQVAPGQQPSDVSDVNGRFTLVFSDKPPGTSVSLTAQKTGLEVVNQSDLREAAVTGRLSPLQIVMCPEGGLVEARLYHNNIGMTAVLKRYEQQKKLLEKEGKTQQQVIADLEARFNIKVKNKEQALQLLERERIHAENYVRNIAARFAEINLDDMDSSYLLAYKAYEKGDMAAVAQLVSPKTLNKAFERIYLNIQKASNLQEAGREKLALAQKQLRQTAQNALLAARAAGIDFQLDLARRYYELALRADSSNADVYSEYAGFLLETTRTEESAAVYKLFIDRTEKQLNLSSATKYNLARSYFGLASSQMLSLSVVQVLPNVEKAITYFKEYESETNESIQSELAACNAVYELFKKLIPGVESTPENSPNKAALDDDMALMVAMMDALVKNDSKTVTELYDQLENWLMDQESKFYFVIFALQAVEAYRVQKEYDKAQLMLNRIVNQVEIMYNNAPADFAGLYATTLKYKADLQKDQTPAASLATYLKADSLFAQSRNEGFIHDYSGYFYAQNAKDIGLIYFYQLQNIPKAIAFYEKSITLYTQFGIESGDYNLSDYIYVLNELGLAYMNYGNSVAAENAFKRAIEKNKTLEKVDPSGVQNNNFYSYARLGQLYLFGSERKLEKAKEVLKKSIELYSNLSTDVTGSHLSQMAFNYIHLGICLNFQDENQKAFEVFDKGIGLARQYYEKQKTPQAAEQLAYSLQCAGVAALMYCDPVQASTWLDEAAAIREKAAGEDRNRLLFSNYIFSQIKAVEAHFQSAMLLNDKSRQSKAHKLQQQLAKDIENYNGYDKFNLKNSFDYNAQLYVSVPDDKLDLAQTLLQILKEEAAVSNEPDRYPYQQRLIKQWEVLQQAVPDYPNINYALANSYSYLGWLTLYRKDYVQAEQLCRKAYSIAPELTYLQTNLAFAILYQGRFDQAREIVQSVQESFLPSTGERLKYVMLNAIKRLTLAGITHPDLPKLEALLNE